MFNNIVKAIAQFADVPAVDREPTARRLSESGVASSLLTAWDDSNPDELVRRKGLVIYDEMRLDDALGAYLDIKKSAVLSSGFSIIAASNEEEDVERAEFIEYVIKEMRGSMIECLRDILTAMDYGYSITNKPIAMFESGEFKGKFGYSVLKTKEPHRYKFVLDKFRNVTGLILERDNGEPVALQPEEFIVWAYRREFSNPYGRSDYRRAFRWWNSKKYVARMWDMYLERMAGGFMDVQFSHVNPQEHAVFQDFLLNPQTPRTGIMHSDKYNVSILEPSGRGSDVYKEAIAQRNIMMARSVLIPDLLGYSQTPGGALALGKKHFDVWMQVIRNLSRDIEETVMNEQFIRPLIDMNYPVVEEYPRFEFNPISDDEMVMFLTHVTTAVEKGIITHDDEVENAVRKALGLSQKAEEDEQINIEDTSANDEVVEDNFSDDNAESEHEAVAFARPRFVRALTKFEKKVDFATLFDVMQSLQPRFASLWSAIIEKQQDKLIATVRQKKLVANQDDAAVDKLDLQRKSDLEKSLARYMLVAFYFGALQAQNEVNKSAKRLQNVAELDLLNLPLDVAERFFVKKGLVVSPAIKRAAARVKREAFFITGVHNRRALEQAKFIIRKGIRKNDEMWTATQLRKLFSGFLEQGIITDTALVENHRVMTIARTNFSTALNEGRRVAFQDPDVADFIVAYQWSAIIDDRTTDYCRAMDGLIFRKEELEQVGFPPAHYNCRSIVVPIVRGEEFQFATMPSEERAPGF